MALIVGFLFIISIFAVLSVYAFNKIPYETHIEMMKEEAKEKPNMPVAYGTFDDFIVMFHKYNNWEKKSMYPNSWFSKANIATKEYSDWEIHASRFIFEGVGFLFKNSYEFKKYLKWQKLMAKNEDDVFANRFVEKVWK